MKFTANGTVVEAFYFFLGGGDGLGVTDVAV